MWIPEPSMPHGGTPEIVAMVPVAVVLPPPHEDKKRTVRGRKTRPQALQSPIVLIIFVLLGGTSQPLLPCQPPSAVLNVIDADAESNTYALFVDAGADLVSIDPIVHALEECLPLSFQYLSELRQ